MKKNLRTKSVLIPPATETLFSRVKSFWPDDVLNDPALIYEIELRMRCLRALNEIFRDAPNATEEIADTINAGRMQPETLAEFYKSLLIFLDTDIRHARLILYFPFELIPPKSWKPENKRLRTATDRFRFSYMRYWRKLLEETDVRANFVDGDILERELAPDGQPKVRKAAHLIPQLVAKELVSLTEMKELMETTKDTVLRESIADAIASPVTPENAVSETPNSEWIRMLPDKDAYELKKIAMRYALDTSRGMPPSRVAWEKMNREELLAFSLGERLARAIIAKRGLWEDVQMILSSASGHTVLTAIRGIGLATERLAGKEKKNAVNMAQEFIQRVNPAWLGIPLLSDEMESVLSRWIALGLIPETELKKFSFEPRRFDALFEKNGKLAGEIIEFSPAIGSIANNKEYARLFYPVAIFFGSRLKHYAKQSADLDAAVFVRPGTPEAERGKTRQLLARLFKSKKVGGKLVEFWLEERPEGFCIRNFANPDVFLADSSWVHVLFAGVWLGEENALRELYAKLLPGFLYSKGKTFEGVDLQTRCLAEIEHEVLQYRLMHKGYWRFFPKQGGADVQSQNGIDPKSAFWDSGYRRLATKLFLTRVFMPQLKPDIKKEIKKGQ